MVGSRCEIIVFSGVAVLGCALCSTTQGRYESAALAAPAIEIDLQSEADLAIPVALGVSEAQLGRFIHVEPGDSSLPVLLDALGINDEVRAELDIGREGAEVSAGDQNPNEAVLQRQVVSVDLELLKNLAPGAGFSLDLFDDMHLNLTVVAANDYSSGARGLVARTKPELSGVVTLFVSGRAVAGSIRMPTIGTVRIRPSAPGVSVLERVDESRFPPCAIEPNGIGAVARVASPARSVCDDGSEIDVLVVYTTLAEQAAGGTNALHSIAGNFMMEANLAYANSGIPVQVRMVQFVMVDYDESGTYQGHINRLRDPSDGYMDNVHALRDLYHADLVALIVDDDEPGEPCGIGDLMNFVGEDSAWTVNRWSCSTQILAHEFGHNMGCCHAVGDGGGCEQGGLFAYSNGHRFVGNSGQQWRTVMAYRPGERIPHFSNPQITFDGQPTGVDLNQPQPAHNALTINQTAVTVANFRPSAGCIPDCPWDCGNFDGSVGIVDFLALLAQWGQIDTSCDVDGGGVGITDLLDLVANWGPCPGPAACGPGHGACCLANGTPGCEDISCCASVCAIDPFCCDVEWDGQCAAQAQIICSCTKTCGPGHGDCCIPNGTPGCVDASCCNAICATDPFCCDVEWDGMCAAQAQATCDCAVPPCGPGYGACCVPNGTPGCEDVTCCNLVCGGDPFCCDVEWDGLCAEQAQVLCECP